jgi:hypothetical protein
LLDGRRPLKLEGVIRNDLLSLVLLLLAFLGVFALMTRLGRAVLRLGLNAAEATAASGLAEVSERRGDITGFLEGRASGQTLRRARRRNLASMLAYALLIAIPPFTPVAREVYAAAALLWLLPRRPVRPPVQLPGA